MATSGRNTMPVELAVALKAHQTLIPLALFVAAFAGAMFVLRWPPAAAGATRPVAAPGSRGVRSSPDTARSLDAAGMPGAARAAGPAWHLIAGAGTAAVVNALPADRSATPASASDGTVTAARDTGTLAAESPSPNELQRSPGNADAQHSFDNVDAAIDALDSSFSPDDRVRAIQSLAATAGDGPTVSRARTSLHIAAADEDADIAARAQEAYEALVEREDR